METITGLIGFGIGVVIGYLSMKLLTRRHSVGDLRIDTSDPDGSTYLFLELSTDLNAIRRKKYVTLKVNTISYIPHE